jgi:dipeptidyl aminopeptidase/acylaminoacyl peptidase
MLLIHGDKDDVVPVEQTHLLHHALTKAGIESTEIIIGNTGHATPDFSRPEILAAIDAFLTRHLKPTTP